MTILDKARKGEETPIVESKQTNEKKVKETKEDTTKDSGQTKPDAIVVSDDSQMLSAVESQFKTIMQEFQANKGFSVNTGEQPVDTMVELLSSSGVNVSIVLLLSFIRYCINHGLKKEITLKIGYNKPAAIPMNFAVNEELLEEVFPGDVVEIN
jgi:hypothetical protein